MTKGTTEAVSNAYLPDGQLSTVTLHDEKSKRPLTKLFYKDTNPIQKGTATSTE